MDKKLIWGPILIVALYMFLPWVLSRVFGVGAFRKGKSPGKVSFTFDDGPNPHYTPMLLDLLKSYGIKATFFVLGSRAEQYPELIRRIHEEGHEIGIHNYTHKSNWIMLPWTVKNQHVEQSADIVERITGKRPTLYRPPWGIMNLMDFWLPQSYHVVLWSVMGGDWSLQHKADGDQLARRLLKQIKSGSVILLHDSGDTFGASPGSPAVMLNALQVVLEQLRSKNYEYVTVQEMIRMEQRAEARCMSRTKKTIVALWLQWERFFVKVFRITPIDEKNTLIKLRVREYTGDRTIYLEDGEMISKGDRIAELHLDNELLFKLGSDARSMVHLTVMLIRRMEQLLPQILQLMLHHPDYKDVKGLYGITIIHRGTDKFGFTVVDLPAGVFSYFTKLYLRLLLYVVHPQGNERVNKKSELLVPKIVAISKQELMNRYIA